MAVVNKLAEARKEKQAKVTHVHARHARHTRHTHHTDATKPKSAKQHAKCGDSCYGDKLHSRMAEIERKYQKLLKLSEPGFNFGPRIVTSTKFSEIISKNYYDLDPYQQPTTQQTYDTDRYS